MAAWASGREGEGSRGSGSIGAGREVVGERGGGGEGGGACTSLGSGALLPGAWQEHLTTKNTFLDCPSPWFDAELRRAHFDAESSRPSSDPTSSSSTSSSRASSVTGSVGSTRFPGNLPGCAAVPHLQGARSHKGGESRSASASTDAGVPASAATNAASLWTPGAVGHQEGRCTPCAWFSKPGTCRDGTNCGNCHLGHASRRRARPPRRAREQAKVEKAGKEDKPQRHAKHHEMLGEMLERAYQEGDAFVFDAAEYIPKYVRNTAYLRQKFIDTLGEIRKSRAVLVPVRPGSPGPRERPRDRSGGSEDDVFSL